MKMDLNPMNIIILLWSFLPLGLTQITCGRLKVEYVYNVNSVDCTIQLFPSSEMRSIITESKHYRWIHIKHSTPRVILQKNSGSYDTSKYGEDNFTLLIRDLNQSDEGNYTVHCWTNRNEHYFSSEVTVKVPIIPSAQPPAQQSSDAGIGTAAVIVILLCAVAVMTIIVVTVILVLRKRTNGHEEVTQLVNEVNTSGETHNLKNEESVYNEIDIDKMAMGNSKKDERASTATTYASINLQDSPALPSRPDNLAGNNLDKDYDLVKETDELVRDSNNPDAEYAEIAVISPVNVEKATCIEITKDFNETVTVSMEKAEGKIIERTLHKHDSESESRTGGKTGVNVKCENNANFPEHAKVQKRKHANNITDHVPARRNEYKITFPEINCSEITQSLGEGFQMKEVSGRGEPVTYSNLVSRPNRIKSRQSRASRRSLQYAVLDLAEPETDHSEHATKSDELLGKLQPCQYASIDFDKRAFIAPVRKAPSSWYKRRNKKGKGK